MSWTVYYSSTRRSMGSFDITCVAFSRLTLPIFTSVMGLVQSKLKSNGIFRTVFSTSFSHSHLSPLPYSLTRASSQLEYWRNLPDQRTSNDRGNAGFTQTERDGGSSSG